MSPRTRKRRAPRSAHLEGQKSDKSVAPATDANSSPSATVDNTDAPATAAIDAQPAASDSVPEAPSNAQSIRPSTESLDSDWFSGESPAAVVGAPADGGSTDALQQAKDSVAALPAEHGTATSESGPPAAAAASESPRPRAAALRLSSPPPPTHVAWSRPGLTPPMPSSLRSSHPPPAVTSTHPSVPAPSRPPPAVRPSIRHLSPPPPPLKSAVPPATAEPVQANLARSATPLPSRPPLVRTSSSVPPPGATAESSASQRPPAARVSALARPDTGSTAIDKSVPQASADGSALIPVVTEYSQVRATEGDTTTAANEVTPDQEDTLKIESLGQGTLEPITADSPSTRPNAVQDSSPTEPPDRHDENRRDTHQAAESDDAPPTRSDVPRRRARAVPAALPRNSRRSRLLWSFGAIGIVGIGLFALRPNSAGSKRTLVAAQPSQQPSAVAQPVEPAIATHRSAPPAASTTATGAAPAVPSSEDTVRVAVNIRPEGARVFYRGKEIGRTPFTLELLRDERRVFEVGYPGYVTRRLVIDGSEKEISFAMTPGAK